MRFARNRGTWVRPAAFLVLACASYGAVTEEDYTRAEKFLPHNVQKMLFRMRVEPHWVEASARFWYQNETREGREFILVDPSRKTRSPAFDQARLAASLSEASGQTYKGNALPIDSLEYVQAKGAVAFSVGKDRWVCDLSTYRCVRDADSPRPSEDELRSPDGRWAAFVKDNNLLVRPTAGGADIPLTTDGEVQYGYAGRTEGNTSFITHKIRGTKLPPVAVWAPDSKKIVACRLDERKVKRSFLLQSAPPDGSARPVLHTYKLPLPGDADLPLVELVICDLENKSLTPVRYEKQPVTYETPIESRCVWWSRDGLRLYYLYTERAEKALRLVEVEAGTGSCREVLREEGATHVETTLMLGNRPNVRDLPGRGEFIWFSQKDGWAHIYLHDLGTGRLKNRITDGPWVLYEVDHVDEARRWVYFTALGREHGRDPYYRHLYRARLDGSKIELLTPEDADHSVTFSPDGRFFVDVYSRLDLPPVSVIRSLEGRTLQVLEKADMGMVGDLGWSFPERFTVKAEDGITDIYGMIVRPSDFDPGRKYPVIDAVYPGPQVIRTPVSLDPWTLSWLWEPQALAELGFVVVTIDGRGTPFRSKTFHDFAYGNFKDGGALQDHVAGLRQLGLSRPYMDLSRVGVYGHSAGGFAAARAILLYPDFYKVAVASAGNHDQRGNNAGWGEKYLGLPVGHAYDDQINGGLVANLKGRLLLAHGDMDDNVSPALTIQLAEALIKANKDFDLLILPNANHSFEPHMSYFIRKKWDFFVRHLLGENPPEGYRLGRAGDARGPA